MSDDELVLQRTLSGEEHLLSDIEALANRPPDTFRWCNHCEEHILRSRFGPHEAHDREAASNTSAETADDDDEEPTEKIGAWFDITLSYTVDYRFKVPAWDKHEAVQVAKELQWEATPAESYHVHTETDTVKAIWSDDDDLPDDFDRYQERALYDALVEDTDP